MPGLRRHLDGRRRTSGRASRKARRCNARQQTKQILAEVMGAPIVAEFKKEQEDVEEATRRIRKLFGFFTLN